MFAEMPQTPLLLIAGAFLLGWILSSVSSALGSRYKARKRDHRDDRIRSLEAELRVAQGDANKAREKIESLEKELKEANDGIGKRDNVITHQQSKVEELKRDLRDSVRKTRELRAELTERATEYTRSEVKLREVETELSIAQASSDLIATGVLDYSLAPEAENEDDDDYLSREAGKA